MQKHYLLSLFISGLVIMAGCRKNDEPGPGETVVGQWQATSVKGKIGIFGANEDINENVEQEGLVYEFKTDGTFMANGTLDEEGSVVKQSISGKYTVTNDQIKLTYRESGQTKDTVEYYKLSLTGNTITFNLTKDLLTVAINESDPSGAGALLLSFISSLDITYTFKKI
ncbi:MAG: lipocalin family protein [Spirosomataceae bacterium]